MSEKTAEVLDRCLESARSGRDPEDILREHPDEAAAVRPLLRIASELAALPAPEPKQGPMLRAVARAGQPRRSLLRRIPAPAWAALITLAIVSAGWGTVRASGGAMPGDVLYPVKKLTERISYATATGPGAEADLLLRFSDRRLREAVAAHDRGRGIDPGLLREMLAHAQGALEKSVSLPDTERAALVDRVACLCRLQRDLLQDLHTRANEDDRQRLAPFLDACGAQCRCLSSMQGCCPNCGHERPSVESMSRQLEQLPSIPQPEDGE
jgi:hypothetical protein